MSRYYDDELYHHGIKGQRWGVRRFQNADGSLKAAGAKRYSVAQDRANRAASEARTAHKLAGKYTSAMDAKAARGERKGLSDRQKTALKVGAIAVAAALAMPRDVSYKYRDRIYYTI